MSTNYRLVLVLFILVCGLTGCTSSVTPTLFSATNTPLSATPIPPVPTADIKGIYLGQALPGVTPQVFAPGLVSIPAAVDYGGTFSADGTEFYFTRRMNDSKDQNIYEMHQVNGFWTEPAPVVFSAGYNANEPHVTADNQTLYFGWTHPRPSENESDPDANSIWATDRTAEGWSAPRYVGDGMAVSSDQNGQLYVTGFATNGAPSLNRVKLVDGLFADFERLTSGVHPAIAPDGSYLVYDNGDGNLRVRFRLADDTWGAAQSLTTQGIPESAAIASISPDGNYLFYTDQQDIYWVSTEIIQKLNSTQKPVTLSPVTPSPTLDPTVKRALMVIFDQFADKEYNIPYALLKADGIVISVASSTLDRVRSAGGKYVRPDLLLSEVNTADYTAIIFVGGEGYEMDNADAMRIAQEAAAQNKVLGAICVAPITLARAGVLQGKRATSSLPPSLLEREGATDTEATVERDGFIITANGPGASQAFGEALVAALRELH